MTKLLAYRLNSASHPALIERMRHLYNENIPSLATKPLAPQSARAQQEWFASLDFSKVVLHLYSPIETPWEIAAFSMVTDRGSHCSPMFALDQRWWGRGYGEEIIQHYLQIAKDKPLRGSQLVSNGAICYLNRKYGWLIVDEKDGVQQLYHPNDRQQEIYDEILRYQDEGPK